MSRRRAKPAGGAIVIHPADNVATAMEALPAGRLVRVEGGPATAEVLLREDIPAGHKFSLRAIARGVRVVKYGQPIGLASAAIPPGRHVHTHNLASQRGRGDIRG